MVIPSRPWQGAPAARAPLHPHRQTGLSDSPFVCPDASVAGSANRSGDHRSRCNVWPLHHQSGGTFQLPRHPHDEGSFRAPLNPIAQPFADWMRTIVFVRWITSRGVPAPCNPARTEFLTPLLLIAPLSSNFPLGELCIHWLHSSHVRERLRLSDSGGTPAARTVLAGVSIQ